MSDLSAEGLALAAVAGLAAGFVGGLVGLVLGVLRLPVLLALGLAPATAAGTNIGISALSATVGSWRHYREGRVLPEVILYMGVPSVVGAFLGGFFGDAVPLSLLFSLIGLILLWQGTAMLRQTLGTWVDQVANSPPPTIPRSRHHIPFTEVWLGLGIGVLGGVVGLILGSLRLPALVRLIGIPPHQAVGSNLVIGLLTGVFGFAGRLVHLQIDLGALVVMGAASMVGSYLGARQTGRISPQMLRLIIGLLLTGLSVPMFWEALQEA